MIRQEKNLLIEKRKKERKRNHFYFFLRLHTIRSFTSRSRENTWPDLFQMTDLLSLEQLVHLSLGDPEAGAVNFNVLKTLLLQMLKAMNLFNYKPTMSDDDQRTLKEALSTSTDPQQLEIDESAWARKSQRKKRDRSSDRLNQLEEKVFRFESQLDALNQIPSNSELIDRAKNTPKKTFDADGQTKTSHHHGPILEVWQYTQMEKRLESAENGITRVNPFLPLNAAYVRTDLHLVGFVTSRSSLRNEWFEGLKRNSQTNYRSAETTAERLEKYAGHVESREKRLGR